MAKSYDEMVIDEINQIKKKIKEGKELIASKVSSDEGTIVLKWLKCGKTDCHCTQSSGHGPYIYHRIYRDGKTKDKYISRKKANSLGISNDIFNNLASLQARKKLLEKIQKERGV